MQKKSVNSIDIDCRKNALNLDDYKSYHDLASALVKEDKLAESVSAYQQAIELYPNFSWSHNNLGNALEKNGNLEECIPEYRRAIELYPNFYLF